MSVTIYFDGDCPFCTHYVRYTRLLQAVSTPRLVNVRLDTQALDALQQAGYDLDNGMVVDIDDQRYAGADAVHALALISTRSGVLNRVTAQIFSRKFAAIMLYPLLRVGRNLI